MRGAVNVLKTMEVFGMEKKPLKNEGKIQEKDTKKKKKVDEMEESDLNGVAGGEGMDTGVIKP
jgi:hypothetical protein